MRVLGTSREPLRIAAEQTLDLAPLSPKEATRLFVERARTVRPGFDPDVATRDTIRAIVERLDGLPLAVELAAARTGVLGPTDILRRLDDRFRLLVDRRRDVPDRQRTLLGALDWSWDLLDGTERAALAQCAAFRGGFDAAAAESVVVLPDPDAWTLDVLESLREKSLLRAVDVPELPAELRLGMLDSVRAYAARRLDELGLRADAEARHRAWYLDYGERLADELEGVDPMRASRRLLLEVDNLEAVRAGATDDAPRVAARAALVLHRVLRVRAPARRNAALIQQVLGRTDELDAPLHVDLLVARCRALRQLGRTDEARAEAERAVTLAESVGGGPLGAALLARGMAEHELGLLDVSEQTFRDTEKVCADAQDRLGRVHAQAQLAYVLSQRGGHAEAEPLLRAAIADARDRGFGTAIGILQSTLGLVLGEQAKYDEADESLAASLESLAAVGDRRGYGAATSNRAALLVQRGRKDAARTHYEDALQTFRELGQRRSAAMVLRNLGVIALSQGRDDDAARQLAEAQQITRAIDDRWTLGRVTSDLGEALLLQGRFEEAEAQYRDGLALAEELGDRRYAAITGGNLALLAQVAGDLDESAARYTPALEQLEAWTGTRVQGYYLAYRGALAAERGEPTADELIVTSREYLEEAEDTTGLAVVEACTALGELIAAGRTGGQEADRLRSAARTRLDGLGENRLAFDVRVVLRIIDRIESSRGS